jgi:hypothetical protein
MIQTMESSALTAIISLMKVASSAHEGDAGKSCSAWQEAIIIIINQ